MNINSKKLNFKGVFCAVVSHPADTIVSKLNKDAGASAIGILKQLGPLGIF